MKRANVERLWDEFKKDNKLDSPDPITGKYVNEIESEAMNKPKLNRLLKSLYVEAQEIE